MLNKELFTLNPDDNNLINNGVVEINTAKDESGFKVIRYELKTFICEGEYQKGLYRILDTYLKNIDQPKQPAVWVSGFFGSGKSHLVKMLGYLWEDFTFPNGDTAKTIKPLPADVSDLFTELERKQKTNGRLSISGTLKDASSAIDIRYAFLQLILQKFDLPQQYHHFQFIHWAKQESIYDDLKTAIEAKGKNFKREVEQLFVSSLLAQTVRDKKPGFAESNAKALESFNAQFKQVTSISRSRLIDIIKNEILPLFFGNKIPLTLIVLDEVQQYIGSDADKSIDLQNLAEDISSQFNGKFLLVGTGQNALSDTDSLQRLQDRFPVKISLTDTDVETVTRKTVLDKKPTAIQLIDHTLNAALGEISRNLSGTDFGYVTSDKATLTADYPILPSTRKFWKQILQTVDKAGTSGQLRSQLRIVDESIKKVAGKELGCIVPADFIFEQKQQQFLQNAMLLNEINNTIASRKAKNGDDALEGRILSAVFLIDQLPKDRSSSRLKSDENTIADLLIDNLNESTDLFRTKVKQLVKQLVEGNVLMPVNDEYKLQTTIGKEWDQEYKAQVIKINSSGEDQIQSIRKEKIVAFFTAKTKTISINQGLSKQAREFEIWSKDAKPATDHKLNIWIRDGWNENEATVLNEIRAEGADASLAYAFVKKLRADELRGEIIKYLAAGFTLNAKGQQPKDGEQAQKSMETRQALAKSAIEDLIDKICQDATIYLAGGNKVEAGNVRENMADALNSIADRQFPEFKSKGDFADWKKALDKALITDPDALKKIGWDKEPKDHPVAIEILRFMSNANKTGREIQNHFTKAPYGWSLDAIDTIIMMLRNTEHISTQEPILTQSKIRTATFKKEVHTLTAPDKIKLRKMYQQAGISCGPAEEFMHSNTFLAKLKSMAGAISGDAPKLAVIDVQFIKDIENLDGNARLVRLLDEGEDLQTKNADWSQKERIVKQREPQWNLLAELTSYAHAGLEPLKLEIEAIRENRLLLQEPNPIEPKLMELTDALKTALNTLKEEYIAQYDVAMNGPQNSSYFTKLTPEQKNSIFLKHQLLGKPAIKPLDAQGLLLQLQKASLEAWQTRIAALPGQFGAALDDAIKLSAPQAQTFSVPRKTITSQADIDEYVAALKNELETLLKSASSIILK